MSAEPLWTELTVPSSPCTPFTLYLLMVKSLPMGKAGFFAETVRAILLAKIIAVVKMAIGALFFCSRHWT